jgi:hypothetical protein
VLNEPDISGMVYIEQFACQKSFSSVCGADLGQDKWRYYSRDKAKSRLTKAESSPFNSHRNIAAAYQASASTDSRPVYPADDRPRTAIYGVH